jgi:hypothetical protein
MELVSGHINHLIYHPIYSVLDAEMTFSMTQTERHRVLLRVSEPKLKTCTRLKTAKRCIQLGGIFSGTNDVIS